jgi:hypothetical protein
MLKLTLFDVGQASTVLMEFGQDCIGIVDFGASPFSESVRVMDYIRDLVKQNRKLKISFLLITHLDLDHISGISELFCDRDLSGRIGRLYCNQFEYRLLVEVLKRRLVPGSGVTSNNWSLRRLESLKALNSYVKRRSLEDRDFHCEFSSPSGNSPSQFPVNIEAPGLDGAYRIRLLAPSQFLRNKARAFLERELERIDAEHNPFEGDHNWAIDWNSASAVLAIEYSGRRVLLCGDATANTFEEILNRSKEAHLQSDVTIAWHHGGRLGTLKSRSYDAVVWGHVLVKQALSEMPLVLISHGCGNRYGHPHPETVSNIRQRGGMVFCTELRKPRMLEPREDAFPFDKVGCALAVGQPKEQVSFHKDSLTCCGDITVEISPRGKVTWSTSANFELSHRDLSCCCT